MTTATTATEGRVRAWDTPEDWSSHAPLTLGDETSSEDLDKMDNVPLNDAVMGSEGRDPMARLQAVANVLAHILALTCVFVVIAWISKLGGLSWKEGAARQVFNWHPLLMVTAFAFMTVASLSFRYRHSNRRLLKLTHGMAWTVAAICAMVALIAVFKSHNDGASGYIANLYSLHSWIGIAVVGLYLSQFLVGLVTFAWPLPCINPMTKSRIMSLHRFFGPFIYNTVAATILLGIQEKEGFIGCSYTVTEADTNPIQHFSDIPSSCRTSHALGVLVLCVTLLTNLAWHDFTKGTSGRPPIANQHLV